MEEVKTMQKTADHTFLELKGLSKHFGGVAAVDKLNLSVKIGEAVGLIGPNGAGKTTVFNLVSGVLKPSEGRVIFSGEEVTSLRTNEIAKRGVVRTFQASVLFKDFTVLENVALGRHLHAGIGFFQDVFNTSATRQRRNQIDEKAGEIVSFMGLDPYRHELAKNLPHGHQRALGIGVALAAEPKLLMLDEPTSGMNLEEKETIMNLIGRIRQQGITILVVEHDMKVVMGLCERIVVLNFGVKIAEGSPDEIRANEDVIQAYLGAEEK
jgi:branched-chain amino acid transport system ATP-binding protein